MATGFTNAVSGENCHVKRILMLYPEFPDTFWSFKHALKFVRIRAALPPLGLLTVAAMLPAEWEKRLIDLNVAKLRDEDLDWADLVFISGMIAQRDSAKALIDRWRRPSSGSSRRPRRRFRFLPMNWLSQHRNPHAALDDACGDRIAGEAGRMVDVEFVHQLSAVFLHGLDADAQLRGGFLVGLAFGNQLQYFHLAR
jgi:hypothetical protein